MSGDAAPHAVVLFDGACNFCSGFVQFVVPRDPPGYFRFAALQSPAGVRVKAEAGARVAGADSLVLIEDGTPFLRSTAALRIARGLRFPWPLLYGLMLVPRPLRDGVYDLVARNRLRWFGRQERCLVPGPGVRERFLD